MILGFGGEEPLTRIGREAGARSVSARETGGFLGSLASQEDSGGPYSYDEFLEKGTNPKHPEHGEIREWAGAYFDLEKFDLEFVNGELRKMKAERHEKIRWGRWTYDAR